MLSEDPPPALSPDVLASIDGALASWDKSAARIAEAEALREQFVQRFAIDTWPSLPVESYALGQQVEGGTVCWWMEFKTRVVASMSGGSSFKHLIFLRSKDQRWQYPKEYGSLEEAWEAVRSGFIKALDDAAGGRFDEIDDIKALRGAAALRTKLLFVYFPDELLPVTSKAHVDHFLTNLGQPGTKWSTIRANRQLLASLRSIPTGPSSPAGERCARARSTGTRPIWNGRSSWATSFSAL